MSQLLKIGAVHVHAPDPLDFCNHISFAGGPLVCQFVLDDLPSILDGVEVRTVSWPVNDTEVLLGEESLHSLGSMTRC